MEKRTKRFKTFIRVETAYLNNNHNSQNKVVPFQKNLFHFWKNERQKKWLFVAASFLSNFTVDNPAKISKIIQCSSCLKINKYNQELSTPTQLKSIIGRSNLTTQIKIFISLQVQINSPHKFGSPSERISLQQRTFNLRKYGNLPVYWKQ